MIKNLLTGSFLVYFLLLSGISQGQSLEISHNAKSFQNIDPPHWFTGMPDGKLQILIHAPGIAQNNFSFEGLGTDIVFRGIEKVQNSNYVLLNFEISAEAKPKEFTIFSKGKAGRYKHAYTLAPRTPHTRGLDGKDIIYLITPDRFANGDPANDQFSQMQQNLVNRSKPYERHGGDIQGIIDHLGYIQNLGITAIWPNPLQMNDQPLESYHGYAITDHYKIDPRFGTNALYADLADSLRQRDMKLIMDVVYNHVGDRHYLYADLIDSSWFHLPDTFMRSNFRAPVLMDPHASHSDRQRMLNGWFDHHMPDLDQTNEALATYLIQSTLWWIETYAIDALRIDTYAYCDADFMRVWAKKVKEAFPDIFLYAETWVHGPVVQGWFMGDALGPEPNYLDALTDFQIYYAINDALTKPEGWTEGINRLYYTLAADYIYSHPEKMVTFIDNHDLARAFGYYNGDLRKMKIALTLLYTLRGIPSVYYGTEILMRKTDGHGEIREDFPGGWAADSLNKFLREDRSQPENEIYSLMQELGKLRKEHPAIHSGSLTQFIPDRGLFVFFRESDNDRIMVLVNVTEKDRSITLSRFAEFIDEKTILENPDGQPFPLKGELNIAPMESQVWILKD